MSISTRPLPGTTIDPRYPDSDGVPLGETDFHLLAVTHLHAVLRLFFRERTDVHVAADMFLYYQEENEVKSRAPDVMVAKGVVGNHARRSFRLWEEGVAPAVIFEIASEKTHHEDEHEKKAIYERLGVKEYFLFDAEDVGCINPRLQGFRLHQRKYAALSPDHAGRLVSQELGLTLEAEEVLLRLVDPRTGRRLMTLEETQDAYAEAAERAQQAQRESTDAQRQAAMALRQAQRALRQIEQDQQQIERAEQQAERARQQIERAEQQAEQAKQQIERAEQQAEQARKQAEQSKRESESDRLRIAALEAEIARLRAMQGPDQTP